MEVRNVFFVLAAVALIVGSSQAQWLPEEKQKEARALWDRAGVEWVDGMKAYQLVKVGQQPSTTNGFDVHGIYDDRDNRFGVNNQYPWRTPAGLENVPVKQWRKISLAYFPEGKEIQVVRKLLPVRNSSRFFQDQPHYAWRFPDGTQFAEILVRRYEDKEWAFEIRVREKRRGAWSDGTTYRPFAEASELPAGSKKYTWTISPGVLTEFGEREADLVAWTVPPGTMYPRWASLVPSRVTVSAEDDDSFVPRNYFGNMMSCNKCHAHAGKGAGYGATTIMGSDTILSWHPFTMATLNTDADPQLDGRWPLWRNK